MIGAFGPLYDRLDAEGFSICLPLRTDVYNAAIAGVEPGLVTHLPPGRAALLIGNTREAWPKFLSAWKRTPALQSSPHPFDQWVEQTLFRTLTSVHAGDWYWGHAPAGQRPSLLHAADAAGLTTGPAWLAAHPEYGPWFALRAVVVLSDRYASSRTIPDRTIRSPCQVCTSAPCQEALKQVRARAAGHVAETGDLGPSWQDWVRIRDACPVGRAWRYERQQLEYHYTKQRSVLASCRA